MAQQRRSEYVVKIVRKVDPSFAPHSLLTNAPKEISNEKEPLAGLFRHGRASPTLFSWGINFLNLLNLFFLTNWLPTIASDAGYTVSQAALIGATLQIGGVLGSIVMGRFIDRLGFFKVLIPCYLISAVAIIAIGEVASLSLPALLMIVFVTGFGIVGGQPANNALSASLYPSRYRATGVSWSLGVGRAGSIIGPILAGGLLQLAWTAPQLFRLACIPAVASAFLLHRMSRRTHVMEPEAQEALR